MFWSDWGPENSGEKPRAQDWLYCEDMMTYPVG